MQEKIHKGWIWFNAEGSVLEALGFPLERAKRELCGEDDKMEGGRSLKGD